jgi:hypothetical protein
LGCRADDLGGSREGRTIKAFRIHLQQTSLRTEADLRPGFTTFLHPAN